VLDHYRKFLQRFPTVGSLAAARESSALAAWSGLGYYRRARMLHAAARTIVKERGGTFPASAEEWRALPGIGRYTAAAIASIAFGEVVAAVDGNVERVLERLLGKSLGGQEMWRVAEAWLSREHPGDFNQAMMELGATVCLPRAPLCLSCPVFDFCATRGELGKPQKSARQAKREIHYSLACRTGSVFLVKRRKETSLMPGMWELPEVSAGNGAGELSFTLRHSITVTDYLVQVSQGAAPQGSDGRWVSNRRAATLPLTGLARKILRRAQVI
jgi:A/G-specific adenine glycosylase